MSNWIEFILSRVLVHENQYVASVCMSTLTELSRVRHVFIHMGYISRIVLHGLGQTAPSLVDVSYS